MTRLILAFESSCDDTSVALLRDGVLVSMQTHTQTQHIETLGVVPEAAARLHADHIFPLVRKVLDEAGIGLADVDMYACTSHPGLVPSLLVGKTVAKMFAQMYDKPIVWVDHIQAHVFSVFLDRERSDIRFPAVVLSASGGHNDLFYWKTMDDLTKIGGTRDDSAGESMDKVGREMGLPFPSGKDMDDRANRYISSLGDYKTPDLIFPVPLLEKDSLEFSFSGLKSAALRVIQEYKQTKGLDDATIDMLCYQYRESVTQTLIQKLMRAVEAYGVDQIYLVGGVSANTRLRQLLDERIAKTQIRYLTPARLAYCGDNAAMIGITAYYSS